MSHAITLGGLLLALAMIGGLGAVVVGALMFFAGSMSDAPEAGDAAGKAGCITFVVGVVIVVVALLAMLS